MDQSQDARERDETQVPQWQALLYRDQTRTRGLSHINRSAGSCQEVYLQKVVRFRIRHFPTGRILRLIDKQKEAPRPGAAHPDKDKANGDPDG
jgi:hypothetical protein